jgi:hypothetical protein
MVYYINDILIFSKNMEDHEHHVCMVLEKLREVGLVEDFDVDET